MADFKRALADRRCSQRHDSSGDVALHGAEHLPSCHALSGFGVTLSGSQVNPGPTLPELHYDYVVLLRRDSTISRSTRGTGRAQINYSKVLRIYDPSTSSAPFNVSANDGNVIGDVTVEPSREK